jgi:carboxylesterase type B
VHGGSGVAGSSTASGLDASGFASRNNVIVVVLQYRLGLFGWLQSNTTLDEAAGGAPGGDKVAGNMALRDVVAALTQLRALAASFGGDAGSVTVMGQSSGAQMVRALLTLPAAQPLFQRAVLVSDTAYYGMATQTDHNALGGGAMALLGCTDIACARGKTKSEILAASTEVFSTVPQANPAVSGGTPWRPMLGDYFPSSITSGGKTSKAVLISTVANEAGATAGALFLPSHAGSTILTLRQGNYPVPYSVALGLIFNAGRGDALSLLAPYATNGTTEDETRSQFELGGTDGLWRCSSQRNARALASAGTPVWLAQHDVGARYISNADNDYCTKSDSHVCHEDDIVRGVLELHVLRIDTDSPASCSTSSSAPRPLPPRHSRPPRRRCNPALLPLRAPARPTPPATRRGRASPVRRASTCSTTPRAATAASSTCSMRRSAPRAACGAARSSTTGRCTRRNDSLAPARDPSDPARVVDPPTWRATWTVYELDFPSFGYAPLLCRGEPRRSCVAVQTSEKCDDLPEVGVIACHELPERSCHG